MQRILLSGTLKKTAIIACLSRTKDLCYVSIGNRAKTIKAELPNVSTPGLNMEITRITSVEGKEFLNYEDRSMRLIRLSDYLPVSRGGSGVGNAFGIIFYDVK